MTADEWGRGDEGESAASLAGESPISDEYRERLAREIAEQGLLTERQATAYLLADYEGYTREAAASIMGCSVSTLDSHLAAARGHLSDARRTLDLLLDLDAPPQLVQPDADE